MTIIAWGASSDNKADACGVFAGRVKLMTDSGLAWWGRGYVSVVVLAGMLILGHSIYSLYAEPIGWNWFV